MQTFRSPDTDSLTDGCSFFLTAAAGVNILVGVTAGITIRVISAPSLPYDVGPARVFLGDV